jgi:hypothetical protein
MMTGDDTSSPLTIGKDFAMNKEMKTMLIECHILMSEAIKGYEDRAYISNKLYEITLYRNKLSENIYKKIKEFSDTNIRPMVYDADYWSFIEKNDSLGSYDNNHHFIIDSDRSLEDIIFKKYSYIHELLVKLDDFMSEEFKIKYGC